MPRHKRRVTIEKCPICGEKHVYQLRLGTTFLFRGRPEREVEPTREFEILLRCPVSNTPFKATVVVPLEDYLWISDYTATVETSPLQES